MFADAVHPTPAPRPRGCWGSKDTKDTQVAVDQTSGRQRMNLHGAIDLEGGQTRMREVLTVDAMSTIELVMMSWSFPFAGLLSFGKAAPLLNHMKRSEEEKTHDGNHDDRN